MQTLAAIRDVQRATGRGLSVFLRDVGHGALELGHNTLALVGLATVAAVIFALGRPDLRHEAESVALNWLQDRFEASAVASGDLLAVVGRGPQPQRDR